MTHRFLSLLCSQRRPGTKESRGDDAEAVVEGGARGRRDAVVARGTGRKSCHQKQEAHRSRSNQSRAEIPSVGKKKGRILQDSNLRRQSLFDF